ncbi:MAG: TonB family protein [Pseudomonadota bacterium]
MRLTKALCVLAGIAALASAPVSAKTTVLKPSGPWQVDFGLEKCRLARLFGGEDNQHLIFFDQYWPSPSLSMTVSGPSFERFEARRRTTKVSGRDNRRVTRLAFGADGTSFETKPFIGETERFGKAVIYASVNVAMGDESPPQTVSGLPQLDAAEAQAATVVSLSQTSKTVTLETGPLGDPFKVLNQCTQQLLQDWGLDVEKHLTAQRTPRWTNEKEIAKRILRQYPSAALYRGEQALVLMRVIVDENGSVAECKVVNATVAKSLESPACVAMKDARFEPALDAAGNPFRSYFATPITYRING